MMPVTTLGPISRQRPDRRAGLSGTGRHVRWGRAVAVLGLAGYLVGGAVGAEASAGVTLNRLGGADRYGTAEAIAEASFPVAPTVVLASGDSFPDGLSAGYLAGRLHSPVLTTSADGLSPAAATAIEKLGSKAVDIVGGADALSPSVDAQLRAKGLTVERIAGLTRYQTAAAAAEVFPKSFVGSLGNGGPTAIVATGTNFADALSGAPMSYSASFPLLLTDPSTLSPDASSALEMLGINQVVLLGGESAVSAGVSQSISALGITVTREAGHDRTDTARLVAELEVRSLGYGPAAVGLARGDLFADALAAAGRGGYAREPILLAQDPTSLGSATTSYLQANAAQIASIDVFGLTSAISDDTASAARAAAG